MNLHRAARSCLEVKGRAAEVLYVLLLPPLLFFVYRVSPVNQIGFLDPWLYTGYANNFADLFARYGLTYYSVRFGLIVPLHLLSILFGPVPGYFVFCYLMYLLAGVPVYIVFRRRFSTEAGVLAYAILVSSLWFARSVLWTHPDAAAVPYMTAAIALLFLDPKPASATFLAIGALAGLAASCNVFTLSISGLGSIGYLILHWGRLSSRVSRDLAWSGLGFAIVWAAGSVGYFIYCGEWNLLQPTLDMMSWALSGGSAVYRQNWWTILTEFHYVFLPPFLGAALLIVVALSRSLDRFFMASAAYMLGSTLFVMSWELIAHGVVLELFYYYCYLLPSFLIAMVLIPTMLSSSTDPALWRRWLLACTISVLVVPLVHAYGINFRRLALPGLLLVLIGTLAMMLVGLKVPLARRVAAIAFSATLHLHWSVPGNYYYSLSGVHDTDEVDAYRVSLALMDAMPKFRLDGRPILFWYASRDRLINSVQSTYLWGYSRLQKPTDGGPGMPVLEATQLRDLNDNGPLWLVLIGRSRHAVAAGLASLHGLGVAFASAGDKDLCSGGVCLAVTLLELPARDSFVGLKDIWPPGPTKILIEARTPSFVSRLEENGYGLAYRVQRRLAAQVPKVFSPPSLVSVHSSGTPIFRPSGASDHVATTFSRTVPAAEGGTPNFRVIVSVGAHSSGPTGTCRLSIQDNALTTLREIGCRGPTGPGGGTFTVALSVDQMPDRLRIVFQSRHGETTPLPTVVSVEQRLISGVSHETILQK